MSSVFPSKKSLPETLFHFLRKILCSMIRDVIKLTALHLCKYLFKVVVEWLKISVEDLLLLSYLGCYNNEAEALNRVVAKKSSLQILFFQNDGSVTFWNNKRLIRLLETILNQRIMELTLYYWSSNYKNKIRFSTT